MARTEAWILPPLRYATRQAVPEAERDKGRRCKPADALPEDLDVWGRGLPRRRAACIPSMVAGAAQPWTYWQCSLVTPGSPAPVLVLQLPDLQR